MKKIKEILEKYWDNNRVEKFCENLEREVLSYKVECLERFLEDIFIENPNVNENELIRFAKNMDAFVNSEEFLVDFFKGIKTPEGDTIAEKLKGNDEEIERVVGELLKLGKIKIIENESEFLVWYI